jgi:hypothetical protein
VLAVVEFVVDIVAVHIAADILVVVQLQPKNPQGVKRE